MEHPIGDFMLKKKNETTPEKKTFLQALGITRTVVRPPEEADLRVRQDRIGRYFKKYLNKFVFAEFSDDFMAKHGVTEIMKGVPVPLRKQDVKEFAGGNGLRTLHIAENMAWIMGCDPKFKYTQNYIDFLNKLFNYKIYEGMMKEGRDMAEEGDLDAACIHFRASLCMKPDYLHSMYSYARCCRAMYLASKNEEYIGRFKAEALEFFELLTETHPRFANGYYYLGYAYLNIGLYVKAQLTWMEFLRFSKNSKDKKEIRTRIEQLRGPVEIEKGYNAVLAGRYHEGIEKLEPFMKTNFKSWWPMSYYLGVAYDRLGKKADAINAFKRVLTMNATHLETLRELAAIYKKSGDKENYKKYSSKADLVEKNMKKDREDIEAEKEASGIAEELDTPKSFEPEHIEDADEIGAADGTENEDVSTEAGIESDLEADMKFEEDCSAAAEGEAAVSKVEDSLTSGNVEVESPAKDKDKPKGFRKVARKHIKH